MKLCGHTVGFYEKSSALATFSLARLKRLHVFRYDTSKTTEGKTRLPLIALKWNTLVWCKNVVRRWSLKYKDRFCLNVSLKSVRLYLFDLSNTLTVFIYSNLTLSLSLSPPSLSLCLPFTVNVTLKNNGVRLDAVIKAMRFWEVIMDISIQTATTIIEIVHIIWIHISHIEPEMFLRVGESWWRDRWLLTTTINTITRQALECIFFYCLLTLLRLFNAF